MNLIYRMIFLIQNKQLNFLILEYVKKLVQVHLEEFI